MLIAGSGLTALLAAEKPELRATLSVVVRHREMSRVTVSVMREEAERIWIREGVQLRWEQSPEDVPSGAPVIRLELVDECDAVTAPLPSAALAEFRPDLGTIRVSVACAAETARLGLTGLRRPLQPFDQPLALGYVLGRAVAHEIGHSLLGGTHTDGGLMQASFSPGQMVDRLNGRFRLTPTESARLLHQLEDGRIIRVRGAARQRAEMTLGSTENLAR